jgi:hypothetical protein
MRHQTLYFVLITALFLPFILRGQLNSPMNVTATGYDSHVEINWSVVANAQAYEVWRSNNGGVQFSLVKTVSDTVAIDFVRPLGLNLNLVYKIRSLGAAGRVSDYSATAQAFVQPASDSALLDMVQRYTFRYFREFAHPVSGLARERNTSGDVVTTGGTGFGIMAWLVAIERGWVSRTEGVNHLSTILAFLLISDRYHGVFPHWLNGRTGETQPFSTFDNGGDLVETSFLIQGLLTARQYFNRNTPEENWLRQTINQIWRGVEWDWHRRDGQNVLYWHWSPNYGWRINFALRGYYEALITYILAVASPTRGIPATVYHQGWAGNPNYRNGQSYYGHRLQVGPLAGGPLFFAHYSYLGFDPRGKRDAYANYWLHNIAQSLINWEYCRQNPGNKTGYSVENWGLTSSDDPNGYSSHEPFHSSDNGTITPTAALSSMPYTPVQSMAALKHFYRDRGDKLWGKYGFYDAFNLGRNWYASSYLAIDQGPIVVMIENYRTGLLWRLFMQNPEIQAALDAIGFQRDATAIFDKKAENTEGVSLAVSPNPSTGTSVLVFNLKKETAISVAVIDGLGRTVLSVSDKALFKEGDNRLLLNLNSLPNGFYSLILRGEACAGRTKILLQKP